MSRIRDFLRDKGFVLVLLACVAAAVATAAWAVQTVRGRLRQELDGITGNDRAGVEDYPGIDNELGGDDEWQLEPGLDVAGDVQGVPRSTASPAPSAQPSASPSPSGSSQASSAAPSAPGTPAAAQTPSFTSPVSGRIVQACSGDELVYNETLGDWRTHNGVDYLCSAGETVFAPAPGTVTAVSAGGNWGGVVEITAADGAVWRVCGVSAPVVKQGQTVNTGNQLGSAGTVAAESLLGDHIHLEIEKDGRFVDPSTYLK